MKRISRRHFIIYSSALLSSAFPCHTLALLPGKNDHISGPDDIKGKILKGDAPATPWKWSHEGYFYKKLKDDRVVCGICPNRCILSPGDRSVCRSRVNIDGVLYSLAYGNPCALHVDPIEKKPLYHFKPRSKAFSLATTGCNFRCLNCQNWEISQVKPTEVRHHQLFPSGVIKAAMQSQCKSIA